MLNLASRTPPSWIERILPSLNELLVDHAHCEKKAAGNAMNLIFSYVEHTEFVVPVAEIAREELEHFAQVIDILNRRKIPLIRQTPSSYGARLKELIRHSEPERAIDRCLIAAFIEARSCERFTLLAEYLPDAELRDFYATLLRSEARHHTVYVQFAKLFAPADIVNKRLEELADAEAAIIAKGDPFARVHS